MQVLGPWTSRPPERVNPSAEGLLGSFGELEGLATWVRSLGYDPGSSLLCFDDPAAASSPAEMLLRI